MFRGLLHKTFTGEKLPTGYFNRSFFPYGKVNGKIMLSGVFFAGNDSFMQ